MEFLPEDAGSLFWGERQGAFALNVARTFTLDVGRLPTKSDLRGGSQVILNDTFSNSGTYFYQTPSVSVTPFVGLDDFGLACAASISLAPWFYPASTSFHALLYLGNLPLASARFPMSAKHRSSAIARLTGGSPFGSTTIETPVWDDENLIFVVRAARQRTVKFQIHQPRSSHSAEAAATSTAIPPNSGRLVIGSQSSFSEGVWAGGIGRIVIGPLGAEFEREVERMKAQYL